MQELDTPTFRLAVAQFDQAAAAMELDPNLRERLKLPQRSLVVSLPVRMDDGQVEVFTGYRVQHDSSRGPSNGNVRWPDYRTAAQKAESQSRQNNYPQLNYSG